MSREIIFKCFGNKEETRLSIKKFVYGKDDKYDEFILNLYNKWAWAHFYNEPDYNYINVKFSKKLSEKEIENFVAEMESIGFVADKD